MHRLHESLDQLGGERRFGGFNNFGHHDLPSFLVGQPRGVGERRRDYAGVFDALPRPELNGFQSQGMFGNNAEVFRQREPEPESFGLNMIE